MSDSIDHHLYTVLDSQSSIDLNHCRDIFCAGRVVDEDLRRTMKACGGAIQTSVNGLTDSVLGTCKAFQEEQIGGDR